MDDKEGTARMVAAKAKGMAAAARKVDAQVEHMAVARTAVVAAAGTEEVKVMDAVEGSLEKVK